MDSKLKKVIDDNLQNFSIWDKIRFDYLNSIFGKIEYSEEEEFNIVINYAKMLCEILTIFVKYGKFKDNWSDPKFSLRPFSLITEIISNKTGCSYEFFSNMEGLYLQSYLIYNDNLKRMNDKFWAIFIELSNYGYFEFIENSCLQTEKINQYKHLLKNNRSNLFSLLRNYLLLDINQNNSVDIGWLSIKWAKDIKFEQLLINGCQAFKRLYAIDYLLYKVDGRKLFE